MVKITKTTKESKQQQRVINKNLQKDKLSPEKIIQKQRLLELSFGKLNAELAKKDSDLLNSYGTKKNIFMDILKIPPVIDLGTVDDNISNKSGANNVSLPRLPTKTQINTKQELVKESLLSRHGHGVVLLNSPSNTEEEEEGDITLIEENSTNKKLKQKIPKGGKVEKKKKKLMPTSVKSSTSNLQSSPIISSTILSRQSKQKTVAQIKEQLCHSCVTNIENASVERVQSDLDLRQKLPQVSQPSTSKNSENRRLSYTREEILTIRPPKQENSVEELSLDHKIFASRIRYEHRSSKIDLSKNYKLVGLRYYQQILVFFKIFFNFGVFLGDILLCLNRFLNYSFSSCDGRIVRVLGFTGEWGGFECFWEIFPNTNKFLRIPLSVVSFNVLCQHYVNVMSHLYQHLRGAKSAHKLWNSRKQKLELEFDRIDADIFCLQEVQDVHYEEFYLPYFTSRGFQGLFTRKTGGLQTPDGCAIFWRQSKITLLYINQVSYNLFIPPTMNSPNIGQVAIFGLNDCLYNSSAFCISNTHIFFQMKKGATKLAQIAYLLGHMKKAETEFVASMKLQKDPIRKYNFVGHILCGDFNIEPTFLMEQKADLRAMFSSTMALRPTSNTIPSTPPSSTSIPLALMKMTKNCELVDSKDPVDPQLFIVKQNTSDFLSHDFSFASVYEHFNAVGEPEISSYHMEESTPDFILYTIPKNTQKFETSQNASTSADSDNKQNQLAIEGFIQLRKRLSLPTLNELEKACGRLPNEQYGSDHLLLCAEFDILCPIIKP
ncbi:unnamed protein product [Meloidogyne enterolobii]|uniref:Uncharacterized protein n=1 Tax=Meloidogyne enterolobii TaxID=390850 RepID=A0ACB1A9H1_MELEN